MWELRSNAESTGWFPHPVFDIVDTTLIQAEPSFVFAAFLDEIRGHSSWWRPMFVASPRDPAQVGHAGAIIDVQLSCLFKPRFTGRMVEVITDRLVRVEFIDGDFLGTGVWHFEPSPKGTEVRFRWQVRGNRFVFRIVAPIVDLAQIHSDVVQDGFDGLREHVRRRAPAPVPTV